MPLRARPPARSAHVGGAQTDDTACAICHKQTAQRSTCTTCRSRRRTRAARCTSRGGNTNTNSAWIASNSSRLPAGAIKVTLRHQERVRQRQRPAGDGVPDAAKRRPQGPERLRHGGRQPGHGAEGDLGQLHGFAERRTSCGQSRRTASPNRPTSTPPRPATCATSGPARATGTGAGTLSSPDADGYYTVTLTGVNGRRQREDAHRWRRLHVQREERTAADADQRRRLPGRRMPSGPMICRSADQQAPAA